MYNGMHQCISWYQKITALLQKELKSIETQIETNTKIAELEAKTENKALKEVEEANTFITHESKMVTQAEELVTNVT